MYHNFKQRFKRSCRIAQHSLHSVLSRVWRTEDDIKASKMCWMKRDTSRSITRIMENRTRKDSIGDPSHCPMLWLMALASEI